MGSSRQWLDLRATEVARSGTLSEASIEDQVLGALPRPRHAAPRDHELLGLRTAPVLLSDEMDRADDEFEALLFGVPSALTMLGASWLDEDSVVRTLGSRLP